MNKDNQKLRDDMMFFYGNLDALIWACMNDLPISSDMIENMKEQYVSFLKQLFEGFEE